GDESWAGPVGHIGGRLLATVVPNVAARRAHVCGPPAMMGAVKAALIELGVSEVNVRTEAFGTIKRNPTAKTDISSKTCGLVRFQASDTSSPLREGATILDAADEAGVFIDNACRSGTCGSCRVKLLSGSVSMDVRDALSAAEQAEGYVLACQATGRGEISVDA
ncbi:MAG TPA: 2Fe-2S iron-sulfur cluster-binding protein, partial [Sphingomicrobium sp.]|nr:2Fe-2S iron-sulfur cluster-binding protein [Sphingomicrobium sp.]